MILKTFKFKLSQFVEIIKVCNYNINLRFMVLD